MSRRSKREDLAGGCRTVIGKTGGRGWINAAFHCWYKRSAGTAALYTDAGGSTRGLGLDEALMYTLSLGDWQDRDNSCLHLLADLLHCYRPAPASRSFTHSLHLDFLFLKSKKRPVPTIPRLTIKDDKVPTARWRREISDKSVVRFMTPIFRPSDFKCR